MATLAGRTLTLVGAVLDQPGAGTPRQLTAANEATTALLAAAQQAIGAHTALPAGPLGTLTTAWGTTSTVTTATPLRVVGWPGLTLPVLVRADPPDPRPHLGRSVGTLTIPQPGPDASVAMLADSLHQIRYHVTLWPYDLVWNLTGAVGILAGLDILAALLCAHGLPDGGGSIADRHLGARLLYYGGDGVDVLLAVAVMAGWYARTGRRRRHARRRAAPHPAPS